MVNVEMLKSKISERGTNVSEIAERIGIDKATLYRRISEPTNFTIGEVISIASALSLTEEDVNYIFFNGIVAQTQQMV